MCFQHILKTKVIIKSMRIKTLRIKVESNDQDYLVDDFFSNKDNSYTTNAQLVKEGNDYYWHVLITYDIGGVMPTTKKRVGKTSYFEAIAQLIKKNPPKYGLTKNVIAGNIDYIYDFRTIYDFKKLRNYGAKSIENDREFLEKVIEIVIEHNL